MTLAWRVLSDVLAVFPDVVKDYFASVLKPRRLLRSLVGGIIVIREFLAEKCQRRLMALEGAQLPTFSKSSCNFASVCLSSSVGFGGILEADANCE